MSSCLIRLAKDNMGYMAREEPVLFLTSRTSCLLWTAKA